MWNWTRRIDTLSSIPVMDPGSDLTYLFWDWKSPPNSPILRKILEDPKTLTPTGIRTWYVYIYCNTKIRYPPTTAHAVGFYLLNIYPDIRAVAIAFVGVTYCTKESNLRHNENNRKRNFSSYYPHIIVGFTSSTISTLNYFSTLVTITLSSCSGGVHQWLP